jgi:hypothetical protein
VMSTDPPGSHRPPAGETSDKPQPMSWSPAQRAGQRGPVTPSARSEPMPWSVPAEAAADPGSSRRGWFVGALMVLALVVAAAISAVTLADRPARDTAVAIRSASATPVDPAAAADASLQSMAVALLRADETGWMAGVDVRDARTRAFFQHRF